MPRTTLKLKEDAIRVAKAHATRHELTLGQAVSELVRQAVGGLRALAGNTFDAALEIAPTR